MAPVIVVSTKKKTSSPIPLNTKGYFCTGYTAAGGGTDSDNIDGFVFDTEIMTQLAATVATPKESAFCSATATKGYIMGGYARGLGADSGNVEALIFSNESTSNLGTILTAHGDGASCYSSTIGYCMGGSKSGSAEMNLIEGLIFASETLQTVTTTLNYACRPAGDIQNSTKGFIFGGFDVGGWPDAAYASIQEFTFSNESMITAAEALERTVAEYATNSFADDGYCFAGRTYYNGSPYFHKTGEKDVFATGVTSEISDTLAVNKDGNLRGTNQAAKGVIVGGSTADTSYTPSYSCETFIYATETVDAISEVLHDAYSAICAIRN